MDWGDDIHTAVARRDSTAIRRLAERARRKEVEMFLCLVAEMVERELQDTLQLKKKSAVATLISRKGTAEKLGEEAPR